MTNAHDPQVRGREALTRALLAYWNEAEEHLLGCNVSARLAEARRRVKEAGFSVIASPAGRHRASCHDCGRPYGDEHGFPDLVVPDDVWNEHISPTKTEGGLLCPSCMAKRAHDAGLRDIPAHFASGPFALSEPAEPREPDAWLVECPESGCEPDVYVDYPEGVICPECGAGVYSSIAIVPLYRALSEPAEVTPERLREMGDWFDQHANDGIMWGTGDVLHRIADALEAQTPTQEERHG